MKSLKTILGITGLVFLFVAMCYAASVSGTHTVDGSNPAAGRFKVAAFAFGTTRDISQSEYRFGTASVAADGTWSISGFDTGETVIIQIWDSTDVKKAVTFEQTAE